MKELRFVGTVAEFREWLRRMVKLEKFLSGKK